MNILNENSGKIALVTGGSRGIGLGSAIALAHTGAKVILVGRDEQKLIYESNSINSSGGDALYFKVDFDSTSSVYQLTNFCESNNLIPDILINGLGGGFGSNNWDLTSTYSRILNLNFLIAQELTAWVAPKMIEKNWGRIIYFGTLSVNKKSSPAPYVSAKSALGAYMKIMAKDIALKCPEVVLSMISPGAISVPGKFLNKIETEDPILLKKMIAEINIPANRLGKISEITELLLFLCSNRSSYMHGSHIEIDGGASN